MAVLVFKTSDGKTQETPLGARLVIGRSASCGIRVEDPRVSRRHAEICRQGAECFVKDLGSRNGTRVNGRPITLSPLAYGDEIGVGATRILFLEQAPTERVGTVLAGYEFLEPIGHGGTGIVYRARQVALGRIVALKVLHPRWTADRRFVERFLEAARAAQALTHVNVVHVHDSGEADDVCFCATEFVEGPSAAEHLRVRGPFPSRTAIEITRQIASALAYAHKQGILHRDVKPENILLAPDGTAKLADLGLATSLHPEPAEAERGADAKPRIWGTAAYIAPEVALGEPPDPRSDLYSLGATLFHMLTGFVPFPGTTAADILSKHVHAPPPELQAVAPDVPRALNPLIEKLMAKRRERRHQSADELIADLTVVREVLRQAASSEETRFLTPLPPAPPSSEAASHTIARLVAKWLRR